MNEVQIIIIFIDFQEAFRQKKYLSSSDYVASQNSAREHHQSPFATKQATPIPQSGSN